MLLSVTSVASSLCVEGLEALLDSLISAVAVWSYHGLLPQQAWKCWPGRGHAPELRGDLWGAVPGQVRVIH